MRDYYESKATATFSEVLRRKEEQRKNLIENIKVVLLLIGFIAVVLFCCIYKANDNTVSGHWEKNPRFISFDITPDEEPSIWVED